MYLRPLDKEKVFASNFPHEGWWQYAAGCVRSSWHLSSYNSDSQLLSFIVSDKILLLL